VSFTVETPDRDRLAFLPGQYVNIAVPGTQETRSYSFSNAPDDTRLTFLVKLTPGGVMSDYLAERTAVGDAISFTGPNGSFFLRETERPVLLLAGGTGLAPILSILRKLRTDCATRPVHLVYGVSTDADLVDLEALDELAGGIEGFTWGHCVAGPDSAAPNKGYVMSLIRSEHLYDGDVAVYLCGPPPMVEAVRTHFADTGVEPTGFYYEKFALSGAAPAARDTAPPAAAAAVAPAQAAVPPAVEERVPAVAEQTAPPAAERVSQRPFPDPHPDLVAAAGARAVAGQEMLPAADLEPLRSMLGADPR
jgi:benzoate/toluate 1,2-dioxygenase reductase component